MKLKNLKHLVKTLINHKKSAFIVVLIWTFCLQLILFTSCGMSRSDRVKNVASLVAAVNQGNTGDTILVGKGKFKLKEPLLLKSGMSLLGVDREQTIITAHSKWQPGVESLPEKEDPTAYLFNLEEVEGVKIANMTLTGKNLHGAIFARKVDGLELSELHVQDFLWNSIRTFYLDNFKVHDNEFVNAGGKQKWLGAAIYMNSTKNSEFWNNKMYRSPDSEVNFFGFKGRKGGKNLRFHHNDVQVNFSFEFPFENYENIEIDHNRFEGVISIPKHGGGSIPETGMAFKIHHNLLRNSYAFEWARNSVEINNNLFDFDSTDDKGNTISNFGKEPASGPTLFHDNLIKNPGLGIFWSRGIYNNFRFYNNQIKSNGTTRTDGFFGFNPASNFKTIEIKNNIIENTADNPRPLMRNLESYSATVENNILNNINDSESYTNSKTNNFQGLLKPLNFKVGVNEEYAIDNWNISPDLKF